MSSFSQRIRWTRIKIGLARPLYWFARAMCRRDRLTISRGGIQYAIDLREGLDLSLFWFGKFQKHVFQSRLFCLPADGVVLDVGANFGLMALQYAKAVPRGHVYAFEPTDYALGHLEENLKLNTELARRIFVMQTFVSEHSNSCSEMVAYSSWPVDGNAPPTAHPVHGGVAQRTETVGQITLDDFMVQQSLDRVNLIKIDTDGYEVQVLRGARQMLEKLKPMVIFEAGQYSLREKGFTLEAVWNCLPGYRIYDLASGREITAADRDVRVPENSTVDLIAIFAKAAAE